MNNGFFGKDKVKEVVSVGKKFRTFAKIAVLGD
jgi:hypothetical protein